MPRPEASSVVRNTMRVAAIAGMSALAASCGGRTQKITHNAPAPPTPRLVEPRPSDQQMMGQAQGLARYTMALVRLGIAKRGYFSFPVACEQSPGQPLQCSKLTPQEVKTERQINRREFSADLPASRQRNSSQDNFVSFRAKSGGSTGTPDLTTLYRFDLQTGTNKPYTGLSFSIHQDPKLSGWDIEAEYSNLDTNQDIQFCLNNEIKKPIGQFLPLSDQRFTRLTADANTALAQYGASGSITPLPVPNLSGGRTVFINGKADGCVS